MFELCVVFSCIAPMSTSLWNLHKHYGTTTLFHDMHSIIWLPSKSPEAHQKATTTKAGEDSTWLLEEVLWKITKSLVMMIELFASMLHLYHIPKIINGRPHIQPEVLQLPVGALQYTVVVLRWEECTPLSDVKLQGVPWKSKRHPLSLASFKLTWRTCI